MGYCGYMKHTAPTTRDRVALERRRLKAGRMFANGETQYAVAKKLGVSTAATCQWHAAWREDKEKGLRSKGPPGFTSQYTTEKKRKLKALVLKGPVKAGYATDFWTVERIRSVAKKELGIDLGIKRTWMTLVELGFSVQKPERRARERDEAAIRDWKLTTFPKLKKMGTKTSVSHRI